MTEPAKHHLLVREFDDPRPEIVVLCGSTRFRETFHWVDRELTMAGYIVLDPGVWVRSSPPYADLPPETAALTKVSLDVLHMQKIILADRVFVIDVDGYIGESTRSQIAYAQDLGKPIGYLSKMGDSMREWKTDLLAVSDPAEVIKQRDEAYAIIALIRAYVNDAAGPWVDRVAVTAALNGEPAKLARRFDLGNPLGWTSEKIRSEEEFNARLLSLEDQEGLDAWEADLLAAQEESQDDRS